MDLETHGTFAMDVDLLANSIEVIGDLRFETVLSAFSRDV